jgi:hypothetical protein
LVRCFEVLRRRSVEEPKYETREPGKLPIRTTYRLFLDAFPDISVVSKPGLCFSLQLRFHLSCFSPRVPAEVVEFGLKAFEVGFEPIEPRFEAAVSFAAPAPLVS